MTDESGRNAGGVLRLPEVERLVGLKRSSVYRLESAGLFPPRVRLSARAVGWERSSVLAWLESRPRAGGGRAA